MKDGAVGPGDTLFAQISACSPVRFEERDATAPCLLSLPTHSR